MDIVSFIRDRAFRATERRSGRISTAIAIVAICALPVFGESGVIEYIDGDVFIVRDKEEFYADFGESVEAGDLVKTGPNSLAVIRINDRIEVKLRDNTHLWIDSVAERASVSLDSGGIFARVAKTAASMVRGDGGFTVKTPSVVAGVRGTEFFVAYGRTIEEEPDLWLCVNEGTVEVSIPSTGQSTIVEEGEGINILGGRRSTEPKPYSWTKELNWNFDPAAGEISDQTDLDAAYADLLDQDYD